MNLKNNKVRLLLFGGGKYIGTFIILITFSTFSILAQTRIVSGVVTEEDGEPSIGVVVINKQNPKIGTITDLDGAYSIQVDNNTILTFSMVGYETTEIAVGNSSTINVQMKVKAQSLDEIVVVGYGTVRKKDLTGAVSVVNADNLRDRSAADIGSALKGMASGVKVTSSGLPGDMASVTIRGISNLTNNAPLYVVDGIPTDGNRHLNLQDVESIQILKDASSAAIYGSRAANGVIIITTKQGKEGPMRIDFSAQLDVNWLPKYDLMDAEEYKKYNDLAYTNAIKMGIDGINSLQNHYDANTDWQDHILQTGFVQNYNLSLSGGSQNGNYYLSLNRLDDSGTVLATGYDRTGFRVNTSGKRGIFSFGENLSYNVSNRKVLNGNPIQDMLVMPPTIPVRDGSNDGGYGFGDPDQANNYGRNPVAMQELLNRKNNEQSLRANIFGQIDLFNMVYAKLNIGYVDYRGTTDVLRIPGSWTMGQGGDKPWVTKDTYTSKNYVLENTYGLKHTFDNHDLDIVAGWTYEHFKGHKHYTTVQDPLEINGKYILDVGKGTGALTSGTGIDEAALVSFLGRINYSYSNKYIASLTIRRDGSSRFSKNNRWDNFPSASFGWRISEENFFNLPWLDDLKLRVSYGSLGGSNIGYWDYVAFINTSPRAILAEDIVANGMTQSNLVNEDLAWEKTSQLNLGFDATLLNNRLTLSAEYFNSESTDLLVRLPILLTTGNSGGNPVVNAGSLQNRGVEIDIAWKSKIGKDFQYRASLNVTHLKNKILDLGYGKTVHYETISKSEIGHPLGSFYLYMADGIFQSYDEIINHTNSKGVIIQPTAQPGDIRYIDANDDGTIGADDRQIVASPWPDLEMGLTLSAEYKGFDVMISGYGKFGHQLWNGSEVAVADFSTNNNNFSGLRPWTEENKSTTQPRIVYGYTANTRHDQDRWLENGSFFRVSEISLGYNLSQRICNKIKLQNVRLGLALRNLITITGYSGLDPDFKDTGVFTIGADNQAYPNPKSVLFSLNLGF